MVTTHGMRIGVVAIQGDVREHEQMLRLCDPALDVVHVRRPEDLEQLNGIIIPGGESTTISLLMKRTGLFEALRARIQQGLPVWGTCAGAILLAKEVSGKNPPPTLAVMDIHAERNAYGTQRESYSAHLTMREPLSQDAARTPVVFIRAPKLLPLPGFDHAENATPPVRVLATVKNGTGTSASAPEPVFLQQGTMLAGSFHSELTSNTAFHQYFLSLCA